MASLECFACQLMKVLLVAMGAMAIAASLSLVPVNGLQGMSLSCPWDFCAAGLNEGQLDNHQRSAPRLASAWCLHHGKAWLI